MNINGYCKCGCGQKANLALYSSKRENCVKGQPRNYLPGHHRRGKPSPNYKNGRTKGPSNSIYCLSHGHPRAEPHGYVLEHRLVAEKALGKYLPNKAVVHHNNGIRNDNRPENLTICEDENYHKLLHQRKRAYNACGNADWLKCKYCKQYDDPQNLYIAPNDSHKYHRRCKAKEERSKYKIKRNMEKRHASV